MAQFDFSGTDGLWQAHDQLRAGMEVPDAQWKRLSATPGYAALTASEFPREAFVRRWVAAFGPGEQAQAARAEYEAKGDPYLAHYLEVSRRRDELGCFQDELARRAGETMRLADARAREFLPAGPEYPDTTGAAFVIFGPDARGYVPVVIDLLFAMTLGDRLWLLLAHEAHHQMVAAARGTRIGQAGYARDDLEWVVDQIHLEGVADMVSSDPARPGPMFDLAELATVPAYLAELDRGLSEVLREPAKRAEVGARLRAGLRLAGHPAGYYIAETISRTLGHDTLAASALDPAEFFAAYRRAADRAAGERTDRGRSPGLSADALAMVRVLGGETR